MRRLLVSALVVVAAVGPGASHARTTARAAGYWLVLSSDRDGTSRAYSVRPDGSRLTPLFAPGTAQYPAAISADGRTVAYSDPYNDELSVSRANGTGLRRLTKEGQAEALSRDGRLLSFDRGGAIWMIGTDGRGLRRLTPGKMDEESDWSPDGKAIVYADWGGKRPKVLVQPVHGRRRVLAGGGSAQPHWSPDGRSIGYANGKGLYVVRPDGKGRRRVVHEGVYPFAWSPDSRKLAFGIGSLHSDVAVVGADGRGLRRLRLRGIPPIDALAWSPDGRRLAFAASRDPSSVGIWVVGADGRGLRRIALGGNNRLVGWTRLAPVRPPAPPLLPSERILGPAEVETRRPVTDLSADGSRVAFSVASTAADCDHVVVWTPAAQTLDRFRKPAPCGEGSESGSVYDVELAGTRAAWAFVTSCGNHCEVELDTATLEQRSPLALASDIGDAGGGVVDFHVHGDGDLLVFNTQSRLVHVGLGSELCQQRSDVDARICSTLRADAHAVAADSVSGGEIAVRERDAVAVLDAHGDLVRYFPFGPDEVAAARLDGDRLVVARAGLLEVYDVATGAGLLQRPLPSGYELDDVDGGIAVLRSDANVVVLRLADGRSFTLSPGRDVLAELEPTGLYYSYTTAVGEGRVAFLPRAEVLAKLGGSVRW